MLYVDRIAALGACIPAVEWLRQENHPTLDAAWRACPRADWLVWLGARCATPGSPEHRAVVTAVIDCAAVVMVVGSPGEDRPRRAVEIAQAVLRGETTVSKCRGAADDAYAASYVVSDDCASAAARAAAYAAACAAGYAAVILADDAAVASVEAARSGVGTRFGVGNCAGKFLVHFSTDGTVRAALNAVPNGCDFVAIVRGHLPNPPVLPE